MWCPIGLHNATEREEMRERNQRYEFEREREKERQWEFEREDEAYENWYPSIHFYFLYKIHYLILFLLYVFDIFMLLEEQDIKYNKKYKNTLVFNKGG